MILIPFVHITDTDQNITQIIWESYCKKYRVHGCSGDIGITICTTDKLIKIVDIFFKLSKEYTRNGRRLFFLQNISIYYLWNNRIFYELRYLPNSASLNKQQGNNILSDTNYKQTHLCYRNLFCPFPKLQEQTNQLHVQGVQWVPKYEWFRWELQKHKESNNQSATWTSVAIKLEIKNTENSEESSGEETCEQTSKKK